MIKRIITYGFLFLLPFACKHPESYMRWSDIYCKHLDNSGNGPVETSDTIISQSAYGILLSFDEYIESGPGFEDQDNNDIQQDRINSIKIYSLRDFDLSHPSGTSLNDYFMGYFFGNIYSISDLIRKINDQPKYNEPNLLLMYPPVTDMRQKFIVEINLDRGVTFTDTLSLIRLN